MSENKTLYTLTKELLDLIKEVKPEIENYIGWRLINESNTYPEVLFNNGTIVRTKRDTHWEYYILDNGESVCEEDTYSKGVYFVPTAETLLTLIPQLFEGVENPEYVNIITEYKEIRHSKGNQERINDLDRMIYNTPRTLSKALLSSYFVDGLWVESQEVLEDLINNINTYLK